MKILLVEDTVGDPIQRALERSGHIVTLVQSGGEARAVLREMSFEFCLIDWMLPDASGVDLVNEIRRDERHHDAGIIMISSRSERADIVTAIGSGIDGYVAKPFKASQLRTKIDEVWQRRSRSRVKTQKISMILEGQDELHYRSSSPLIIFGEKATHTAELGQIDNAHILDYLVTATTAIDAANAFLPRLELKYYLAATTGEVTQVTNERRTRDRAQMAFVSTECTGSCVLMARLIQMRSPGRCTLCIVCDHDTDLGWRDRKELGDYGALVLGRRELDEYRWRDFIEGNIVSKSSHDHDDEDDLDLAVPDEEAGRGFRRSANFWLGNRESEVGDDED